MDMDILRRRIKNWYWNEDNTIRLAIAFEILKEIRSSSCDMIPINDGHNAKRFNTCGTIRYMLNTFLPSFFIKRKDDSEVNYVFYHFFKSISKIRVTTDGQRADIKNDFENNRFGWDLIFDFDNKKFKKEFVNKLKEKADEEKRDFEGLIAEIPDEEIYLKIEEGLSEPKEEAKKVKDFLDSFGCPYLQNSTGSGFRIAIEWKDLAPYFKAEDYGIENIRLGKWIIKKAIEEKCLKCNKGLNEDKEVNYCMVCKKIVKGKQHCKKQTTKEKSYLCDCGKRYVKYDLKPKTIDTSVLGMGMGLTRVIFSFHSVARTISFPLNNDEFNNFNLNMVKPETILNKGVIAIRNAIQDKKIKGDFKNLYDAYFKDNKKGISEKEKKQLKEEQGKKEKINKAKEILSELSDKEREELLAQIKGDKK